MRSDDHILDRAFDGMLVCARARKVAHRLVGTVIGAGQARADRATGGLCP
jgi:hypothetical protein